MAIFPSIGLGLPVMQKHLQHQLCPRETPAPQGGQATPTEYPFGALQRKFCNTGHQQSDDSSLSSQAQSYLDSAAKWDIPTIETPQYNTLSHLI